MNDIMSNFTGESRRSQKDDKGIFRFFSRNWIPSVTWLKNEILNDAHEFEVFEPSQKYEDVTRLKRKSWWTYMKEILLDE